MGEIFLWGCLGCEGGDEEKEGEEEEGEGEQEEEEEEEEEEEDEEDEEGEMREDETGVAIGAEGVTVVAMVESVTMFAMTNSFKISNLC